jgi:predicted house-cleaning noncanonical NTP pyrophosphatase (MazG superfamily)
MFSSRVDESSYIDEKNQLSYFTKNFLNAFKSHSGSEIRIKDIMDYISDNLENKFQQTPFFLIQADLTEKFCSMNNVRSALSDLSIVKPKKDEITYDEEAKTLEYLIKEDAKSHFTEDQVSKLLEEIREIIKSHEYNKLSSFYEISYSFLKLSEYDDPSGLSELIGKWLDDHENEFFAEVKYEKVEVKSPKVSKSAFIVFDQMKEKEYKKIVNGYKLTADCLYEVILIETTPKYPNIPVIDCIIGFVLNKNKIRFFEGHITYKDLSWNNLQVDKVKWYTNEHNFKNRDHIITFISIITSQRFSNFIIKELEERFGLNIEDNPKTEDNL